MLQRLSLEESDQEDESIQEQTHKLEQLIVSMRHTEDAFIKMYADGEGFEDAQTQTESKSYLQDSDK